MKCIIINHNTRFKKELASLFSEFDTQIMNYEEFDETKLAKADFIVLSGGPIHISDKNDLIEEKNFLKKTTKPILGICLGHQILSLVFGSKLEQFKEKKIEFFELELFGMKGQMFYSHIHYIKELPKEFRLLSKRNGFIEAMEHKTKPIFSLQGHPERSGEFGEGIKTLFIQRFVNTSKK